MKASSALLLPLLPLLATAQLLSDQSLGSLPSCASSCTILTQAQSACDGANSQSLTAWECFCKQVWASSAGALTTMCAASCTSASDSAAIDTWYTRNCGSDNGASEHSGTGSSGNSNGNSGGTSTTAGSSPTSSSSTSNNGNDGYTGGSTCTGSWFHCHWQWVVMVIVLAIALTALGVGGRYWKKRHDRKRDAAGISAFNPGITTRSAGGNGGANPYPSQPPPAGSAQMSQVQDPSFVASGDISEVGRNSPSRTREAFMPYGYGYTRSESRLGGGNGIPRGSTPVNEMEKGGAAAGGDGKRKSRRVLVRERSGDGE